MFTNLTQRIYRNRLAILLVVAVVFVMQGVALAQTAAADQAPSIWTQLLPLLITGLVPLLIALTKLALPMVPKWLPPILAPLLGLVLGYVESLLTAGNFNPLNMALYGALGVWLREVVDQLKKLATTIPAALPPTTG
jgi:hypothetical protein